MFVCKYILKCAYLHLKDRASAFQCYFVDLGSTSEVLGRIKEIFILYINK